MTDPASTALAAPRLALGGNDRRLPGGRRARPRRGLGDPPVRPRRHPVDDRINGSAEAIAERLGWLDAPAHFADRTVGLEAFGDAVRR